MINGYAGVYDVNPLSSVIAFRWHQSRKTECLEWLTVNEISYSYMETISSMLNKIEIDFAPKGTTIGEITLTINVNGLNTKVKLGQWIVLINGVDATIIDDDSFNYLFQDAIQ